MKIILADGSQYIGNDANELVVQLKLEDWTSHNNIDAYKQNMKRRVKIFNGQKIKYTNDMEFLQELKRIGFILEIAVDN